MTNQQFVDWPNKAKLVGLFNIQKIVSHSIKILGKGIKPKVHIAGLLFIQNERLDRGSITEVRKNEVLITSSPTET